MESFEITPPRTKIVINRISGNQISLNSEQVSLNRKDSFRGKATKKELPEPNFVWLLNYISKTIKEDKAKKGRTRNSFFPFTEGFEKDTHAKFNRQLWGDCRRNNLLTSARSNDLPCFWLININVHVMTTFLAISERSPLFYLVHRDSLCSFFTTKKKPSFKEAL